jgi:hypothetical protein
MGSVMPIASGKRSKATMLAVMLAALQCVAPPAASEPTPPPGDKQWTVEMAPYGWAPFLTGNAIINGRVTDIDFTPRDVLSHLDAIPFMGYVEARKGDVMLYGDLFYAKLAGSGSMLRARNFGPIGVGVTAGASGEFEQLVAELGGAYELARWPAGAAHPVDFVPFTSIEALAGVRYWSQDLSIGVNVAGAVNIAGLPISAGLAFARSGSVDWFDPLVGLRVRHAFAPGKELLFRADYGGFTVGSDHSWNVLAAYKFEFAIRNGVAYSGLMGYRMLDVDYTGTSGQVTYRYNAVQHGPLLGITARF